VPRLHQINITVPDVGAAVDFYRLVGFDVPDTEPQWMSQHRNVGSPDAEVGIDLDSAEFARQWGDIDAGVVVSIGLDTREDVDATYERLVAAGHPSVRSPYDAFWGARFAIVRDPGGNAIGLTSPIDPAYREPIPDPPPS